MRMNLSELLSKGLVEKFQSDPAQIKNEMEIANNDIASAKKMLSIQEWSWAHNVAYNAILQAGRALMFSKGYRPKSSEHHIAVSFTMAVYSAKFPSDVLEGFSKARLRRSESLYDRVGSISENQGKNLVAKTEIFVNKAKEILKID